MAPGQGKAKVLITIDYLPATDVDWLTLPAMLLLTSNHKPI